MSKPTIKPCPRCGCDKPTADLYDEGRIGIIQCPQCDLFVFRSSIGTSRFGWNEAVEAWNSGEVD